MVVCDQDQADITSGVSDDVVQDVGRTDYTEQ